MNKQTFPADCEEETTTDDDKKKICYDQKFINL